MAPQDTAQQLLDFWFDELEQKQWFAKDAELDALIATRFGALLAAARVGELYDWRDSAEGRLAEILCVDQFSRNVYRDSPEAFAADPLALVLSQEAIRAGAAEAIAPSRRSFLYMPFMHSESAKIHQRSVELFEALGNEGVLDYARKHKAIIDRFGRYPHRNAVLGRASTPEEELFLAGPNSSF